MVDHAVELVGFVPFEVFVYVVGENILLILIELVLDLDKLPTALLLLLLFLVGAHF